MGRPILAAAAFQAAKPAKSRLRAELPAPQFVAESVVLRSHIHVQSGAAGACRRPKKKTGRWLKRPVEEHLQVARRLQPAGVEETFDYPSKPPCPRQPTSQPETR